MKKNYKKLIDIIYLTHGGKIIKKNKNGSEIQLESGQWLQTTFNDIETKS